MLLDELVEAELSIDRHVLLQVRRSPAGASLHRVTSSAAERGINALPRRSFDIGKIGRRSFERRSNCAMTATMTVLSDTRSSPDRPQGRSDGYRAVSNDLPAVVDRVWLHRDFGL